MITKEKFIQYINFIYFQLNLVDSDQEHKYILGILKEIQKSFPKDDNRHCEVSHYIFDLNFGKSSPESEYETPDMLYDRLTN